VAILVTIVDIGLESLVWIMQYMGMKERKIISKFWQKHWGGVLLLVTYAKETGISSSLLAILRLKLAHLCWDEYEIWLARLKFKISGVASQFATQISGIGMQSSRLICNLPHKMTPKTNKKCEELVYKIIFVWKIS
jgi:hypothetical protein